MKQKGGKEEGREEKMKEGRIYLIQYKGFR